MLRSAVALLFASFASLSAQTIETLGGTTVPSSGPNRGKGNQIRVDSSVVLIDFSMQLNVSAPDTLTFFLFRGPTRTGYGTLEWTQQLQVAGDGGAQWYSPGPIALNLVAGNYYVIGAFWTGTVQYFYSTSVTPPMSFGDFQRAHTFLTTLPTTVALGGSDTARYYQQFTTIAVPAVVDTGTGCSSTTLVPKLVADDFFAVNTTTSLELVDALPSAIGLFGLANNAASPVPIPLFNCSIWLDLTGPVFTFAALTSGTGYASLPIPVPNNPTLQGLTFTAQGLVFGATTVDVSNAVTFTIQ